MKNLWKRMVWSALGAACISAGALACGTPPQPPPPPPAPPVVCCRIVAWYIDPICPNRQVIIVCYFREDGLPLFQSNPMPLPSNQQCACGFPKLRALPGVMEGGIAFGPVSANPLQVFCEPMPPDQEGYGPFTPLCEPQSQQQVDSFFDIFYSIGGFNPGDPTDPCPKLSSVMQFRGSPNTFIPPGVPFAVYRKIILPLGVDPNLLCGGLSTVGLFLIDNGNVLIEPPAPGLPPLDLAGFANGGGMGAIYKVKCLPLDLPSPCRVPGACCPGDANGDGIPDFNDIVMILSRWLIPCSPFLGP